MNRVRVKICGITRPEDGIAAADAGADAIGFVFYEQSPRNVNIAAVNRIIRELPPFISKVGLFVDASAEQVRTVLGNVGLDMLQFHGDETAEYCGQYGKPWLKAVRMKPGINLSAVANEFSGCAGLLLDSYIPGKAGGTGQIFNWGSVGASPGKPIVLAGGLHSGNVAEAIHRVGPYAVDVSSGVELTPGVKDAGKIAAFIEQVRMAGE